jgi:predicted HTH transcriptional regulator
LRLRRDAAALANARGGHIIVGVEEEGRGAAADLVGTDDLERYERIISDTLRSSLEPAFDGREIKIRAIKQPGFADRGVLVVAVPAAHVGKPHAVVNALLSEFWLRVGKSKRQMATR